MKVTVGKEPEGGRKKPKEVGNESPLASMFQKQQTANYLQKAREAYLSILENGKHLGLPDAAHGNNTAHIPLNSRIRWMQPWMQQCQNEV